MWRSWMSLTALTKVEATSTPRFPRAVDAHCHLHDARLCSHLDDVMRRATQWNVSHVATSACFEEDWVALDRLLSSSQGSDKDRGGHAHLGKEDDTSTQRGSLVRLIPSFGIHPWWADAKSPMYLHLLRERLVEHPDALLGEIGLCKSARGKLVEVAVQEQTFREQLELASELRRGCVIHCVGGHGKLLEIFQQAHAKKALPPVVILHSYSGPADMVEAFLALERKPCGAKFKIFFSLNAKQLASASYPFLENSSTATGKNPRKPSNVDAVCLKVPLDALLLETDAPDQSPALEFARDLYGSTESAAFVQDGLNEPALVQLAIRGAAAIRKMPLEELAAVVYDNACKAYRISDH